MSFKYLSAAALAIGITSPAIAQDVAAPSSAATVEAGTTIYGSDGAAIGTVARAEGELLLLNVDERAVPIPRNAVTSGESGATINITKTELVAQFDQQMAAFEAKLDAALTAGAAVKTADGQALGTIQEASSAAVVVESTEGPVTLPRELMTLDNEGTLIVRATLDQIKQAMSAEQGQG